jgi:hypothetical protein
VTTFTQCNDHLTGYKTAMTKLLEQAVEKLQTLPADIQDQAAHMLLAYVGDEEASIELTPEEEVELTAAQAETARGHFSIEAELEALLAKLRR